MILTLYLLPPAPLGSCKNSLLWGDLIWLCRTGSEEEEENLELEEVRGGFGPCPILSPGPPLTTLLVSTGTLDRHAGDLTLSPPALHPSLFCATAFGSGQILLEYNKKSELRVSSGICWGVCGVRRQRPCQSLEPKKNRGRGRGH